jgi:hypothetical protein
MIHLISFHAQNTAECENAVLTLRALILCDKSFLKDYEFRLKFHVEQWLSRYWTNKKQVEFSQHCSAISDLNTMLQECAG